MVASTFMSWRPLIPWIDSTEFKEAVAKGHLERLAVSEADVLAARLFGHFGTRDHYFPSA